MLSHSENIFPLLFITRKFPRHFTFAFSVRSLFGEVAIHCMVRDPGPYDLLILSARKSYIQIKNNTDCLCLHVATLCGTWLCVVFNCLQEIVFLSVSHSVCFIQCLMHEFVHHCHCHLASFLESMTLKLYLTLKLCQPCIFCDTHGLMCCCCFCYCKIYCLQLSCCIIVS